jgi:hypothetical protein
VAKEFEIVDVWVGRFPSADAVDAYFEETYGDDDRPISQFATDMGVRFYDHDFIEREFHDTPVSDLGAVLTEHSFSSSYLSEVIEAFRARQIGTFNTVLLVWNEEIENPSSVAQADYTLHYIGRFKCDPTKQDGS